jgi:hypothetical protein
MTNGKLVLQAPPDYLPVIADELVARLVDLGLIGAAYGHTPGTYLAGPRFLQLITFLGCSPHLQLQPPRDGSEDFCHIRVRGPFESARLLSADNTRPPRCPACGKGLTQWRELEPDWSQGISESEILCHSCGQRASPADLNWRRKAGFGLYFIEISGVFPEEAVPLPALMDCLRGNGADWRYFYLQQL